MASGESTASGGSRGWTPYLSVVAAARNDDHGGNLLTRMQAFAHAWIALARRHDLDSELILVEWNPPEDRARLIEAMRWPADTGPCRVRIIDVPPEVHARYRHAAELPLYQMIAKNVGIRRARGEFILAANIDIVFSDELVRFLASRSLEPGRMYRIDRHDVMSDVPVSAPLDEQLAYCRTHIIRQCTREGMYRLTAEGFREKEAEDITAPHSGIYFGSGWHVVERYGSREPFRWIGDEAEIEARVPAGGAIMTLDLEPGPGLGPLPERLEVLDESGAEVAQWSIRERTTVVLAVPPAPAGGVRRIRLRVPNGGRPVPYDARILNFRFFRCDWVEKQSITPPCSKREIVRRHQPQLVRLIGALRRNRGAAGLLLSGPGLFARAVRLLARRGEDIFDGGTDVQAGPGWYGLEEAGGERFRWVSKDAQLAIRVTGARSAMALLVEPGPGVGDGRFVLVVRRLNGGGDVIARVPVNGLTYAEFWVPVPPGTITTISLSPGEHMPPTGADPRILSFRVFACGEGVGARRVHAGAAPGAAAGWPALTIGSEPAEIDWAAALEPSRREVDEMGKPEYLHINGCGDFTLMAREHWFNVRGYPELDIYSMHLDSLLCYAAHHAGAREEMLREPMRIYHIEHGKGWTPEKHAELFASLERRGIPSVSMEDLVWLIARMRHLHAPVLFNGAEDWGLAGYDLPETGLAQARSVVAPAE